MAATPKPTVAVDFDGTIVDNDFPRVGRIKPGAIKALEQLRKRGYRIIIHTCRTTLLPTSDNYAEFPDKIRYYQEMSAFLTEHGVPYDEVWLGYGKPFATAYVDDRAVPYTGCWADVVEGVEDVKRRQG